MISEDSRVASHRVRNFVQQYFLCSETARTAARYSSVIESLPILVRVPRLEVCGSQRRRKHAHASTKYQKMSRSQSRQRRYNTPVIQSRPQSPSYIISRVTSGAVWDVLAQSVAGTARIKCALL